MILIQARPILSSLPRVLQLFKNFSSFLLLCISRIKPMYLASGAACTHRSTHRPVWFSDATPWAPWVIWLTRSDTFLAAECTQPEAFNTPNQVLHVLGRNQRLYNISLLHSFMGFALDGFQLKRPREIKCILEATLAFICKLYWSSGYTGYTFFFF